MRILVTVLGSGCALHIHLEAGVRHDGNAPAIHGAVSLAVGGDDGSTVRGYHGGTVGGGADIDQTYGTSGIVDISYLGGEPGPFLHGGRFTALVGNAIKLGGGLSYPTWEQERPTACLICKADRDVSYTTSFGAVGLYVSGMLGYDGPSVAGDAVFDLVY
jgi:hypothetical protein